MKVIEEEVVDIHKPPKTKKKVVEITESSLWEDSPKIFTLEEEIPPDKWDYQIRKVK